MASNISIKDIDKLLELFRQLDKFLNPKLPEKDKELWEESQDLAKKELAEQLKKRQSGFTVRPGWNVPIRKTSKTNQKEIQKQCEKRIQQIAEKKYYEKDLSYAEAVDEAESKTYDVLKSIDHLLLSVQGPLLQFPRVKSSLLALDWKKHIRDYYRFINKDSFPYQVRETIDVLEALQVQFERSQPEGVDSQKESYLTKYQKIRIFLKRMPRWIYILTIFFAALLTCVYLFWWLWATFFV